MKRFACIAATCPLQYRPNHALLNQFSGLEEDTTMEQWMDEIADYRKNAKIYQFAGSGLA